MLNTIPKQIQVCASVTVLFPTCFPWASFKDAAVSVDCGNLKEQTAPLVHLILLVGAP